MTISRARILRRLSLSLALVFTAGTASADPWIAPGDVVLRHHIEVLADAHVITVPITTWPLMWSGIAKDLARIAPTQLDPMSEASYGYVKAAYERQTQHKLQVNGSLQASNSTQGVRDFGSTRREKDEATIGLSDMGEHWAARAQITGTTDPVDGKRARPDGSYAAGFLGNWAFTAGYLDRWWGPGWQSAIELSDNARPIPGLTLQRRDSDAFQTPWLSWIGPWQFTGFVGQLDPSDRFITTAGEPNHSGIPNTKYIAARLTLKPFESLEIGFSRTTEFGGEGRPEGLGAIKNALLGNSNTGSHGITGANDPTNDEGGYDARYSFNLGPTKNAIYGQMIGEDSAGNIPLPSRFFYLGGLETAFASGDWQHRFSLEGAQTDADGFGSKNNIHYNYVYDHFIYQQGMRFEGRTLGASFDNDTRTLSLKGDHFIGDHHISWTLAYLNLNMDGTNAPFPGGNVYGPNHTKTAYAQLSYTFPVYQRWQLTLGGEYYKHPLLLDDIAPIHSTAFGKIELPL